MQKSLTLALLLAIALPLTAQRAAAQFSLIPYLGYNLSAGLDPEADDIDDRVGALLVGIGAEFDLPFQGGIALKVRPSVETYFLPGEEFEEFGLTVDVSQSRLQVNGDVIAEFSTAGTLAPYVGAGVAWSSYGFEVEGCFEDECETDDMSESGIGLNLLGGARFGSMGFGAPFIQARYTMLSIDFEDEDLDLNGLSVMGGLMIPLGAT